MPLEPASIALKIAPLGKHAIRVLLGLSDVVRLLSLVERDIRQSSVIPHGKHDRVWARVSAQRMDPTIAGCLNAYLTGGDIAAARMRLRTRLDELLRFGDDAINDRQVVELVVRSIEHNVADVPLRTRDAKRLERALTRVPVNEEFGASRGKVALEPALVPVGANVNSPARLLRARSGVLPYAARAEILDKLEAWTNTADAFAACLVGGRGGSGKKRLAVELTRRASHEGWLAGMLISSASQAEIEALVYADVARLIVVDYADTRAEQLEVLLPMMASAATADYPVRVLLLVRSTSRYGNDLTSMLRHRTEALDVVLDDVEQYVLDDLPLPLSDRHTLFAAAVTAFAARHASAREGSLGERDELEQAVFGSPLMVVIAAYLAVHDPLDALPHSRIALLDELLAHEQRYWKANARHDAAATDPLLRRRIVALATLAGADSEIGGNPAAAPRA